MTFADMPNTVLRLRQCHNADTLEARCTRGQRQTSCGS